MSFEDGKSRIVRLANESSSPSPSPSAAEKQKVLRTVSATTSANARPGMYGLYVGDPGSAMKIPPVSCSHDFCTVFVVLIFGGGICIKLFGIFMS